ncbi:uncharacterized protein LOC135371985 [Ornithodoros turicata]|uniref:uncharacterized protein LOC135371985 n=1 Tax=Ornithodoros turicata TaxID=34597 RepID=UPI00313A114F
MECMPVVVEPEPDIEAPASAQPVLEDIGEPEEDLHVKLARPQQQVVTLTECNTYLQAELSGIKSRLLSLELIQNDAECRYYTGFPNFGVFQALFDFLFPRASAMMYRGSMEKKLNQKRGRMRQRELMEEFFMVLVKLRNGMSGREISRNFGTSECSFSKIFVTWINFLQRELKNITRFPTVAQIKPYLPDVFQEFPNTRLVLDVTEVRIQRPPSLNVQGQTFLHYNTYKVVVGCTPDGYISYVSKLWGGSVSDAHIVQKSGVFDSLEPGDGILVDRGFNYPCVPQGIDIYSPPFQSRGEAQCREALLSTRRVPSARVHVERVIRRVKEFHILDKPFPINMVDIAEHIFHVCCYLSNFRCPLIRDSLDDP